MKLSRIEFTSTKVAKVFDQEVRKRNYDIVILLDGLFGTKLVTLTDRALHLILYGINNAYTDHLCESVHVFRFRGRSEGQVVAMIESAVERANAQCRTFEKVS